MTLLLELLRRFWPYILVAAIAGTASFTTAWKLQGVRLTAAEQEFVQYKQDQAAAALVAQQEADKRREVAANEYQKLKAKLNASDAYARCLAAGRCGGLSVQPTNPGVKVPPAVVADGAGTDAVPPAPGVAEAPRVIEDCALTTLMLNRLQADIEAQ